MQKSSYRMRALALASFAALTAAACGGGGSNAAQAEPDVSVITPKEAQVKLAANQLVPYTGADAAIKAAFPNGFSLAVGSGLAFAGKDADGTLWFWGITDRGPNADSPDYLPAGSTKASKSKVFPVPTFAPKLAKIKLQNGNATIEQLVDLKDASGKAISGLPVPPGQIGNSKEIALNEKLQALGTGFDASGMDPEGIALDKDGKHAWICDEYGPFLAKVELATGKIVQKLAPGAGLPDIIKNRQANRGAEGVALTPSGKVLLVVQSILELPDVKLADGSTAKTSKAPFVRIVEFDPATSKTRQFAYPIDVAAYDKAKDAKMGDMVAINDTQLAVIEQGSYKADGAVHNLIYIIDISKATDITDKKLANGLDLEYATSLADLTAAGVTPAAKGLVADMKKDHRWVAEKMEGLAIIDSKTIAIINDNDFGVKASLSDSTGKAFKPDDCAVDAAGAFSGSKCTGTAPYSYKVGQGDASELPIRLWTVRLPKALADYLPK